MDLLKVHKGVKMEALEAVKECAKRAGKPVYCVGLDMGKSKNYMSQTISRGSTPKADTLAKMLGVCGHSLVAIPSDKVTGDMLVIE